VTNPLPQQAPFQTAAAAIIFDRHTGVFDHSLAAAWHAGRGLALADESFATALMRRRRKVKIKLDHLVAYGTHSLAATSRHIQGRLSALFAHGVVDAIAIVSRSSHLPRPPARRVAATVPRQAPVDALRAALAHPDKRAALVAQATDDDDTQALARWLGRLQLLYGVSFAHLVPDERMLPLESIRFFYLDPNWIRAMLDGALSIGLGTSQQVALQATLTAELEQKAAAAALSDRAAALGQPVPAPPNGPTAGFLLRSALASGWPGLSVSGTAGGAALALLRLEHVAPDVLLCLFNGVPDSVTFEAPHEALAFGVEDGKVAARLNQNGRIVDRTVGGAAIKRLVYNPRDPSAVLPSVRGGGHRVLNIATDPNPGPNVPQDPVDLLGVLANGLSVGITAIGPADFALQMVRGPEQITFSQNRRPTPTRNVP
jgi:hypothetical protein